LSNTTSTSNSSSSNGNGNAKKDKGNVQYLAPARTKNTRERIEENDEDVAEENDAPITYTPRSRPATVAGSSGAAQYNRRRQRTSASARRRNAQRSSRS